jgi:hypothetical protein
LRAGLAGGDLGVDLGLGVVAVVVVVVVVVADDIDEQVGRADPVPGEGLEPELDHTVGG